MHLKKLDNLIGKFFSGLILVYQKTLSLDHGPLRFLFPSGFCRFHPTCSQYGREAFSKNGFLIGFYLTTKRVLKCNPWSKGGIDVIK